MFLSLPFKPHSLVLGLGPVLPSSQWRPGLACCITPTGPTLTGLPRPCIAPVCLPGIPTAPWLWSRLRPNLFLWFLGSTGRQDTGRQAIKTGNLCQISHKEPEPISWIKAEVAQPLMLISNDVQINVQFCRWTVELKHCHYLKVD